ncbi:MAG: hypothetical protein AAF485_09985 [Chloroflexota bacterium]
MKSQISNIGCFLSVAAFLTIAACSNELVDTVPLDPQTHYFEETGYTVSDDFLYFFEQYGGVDSLGQPISDVMIVSGWQVQYFENGRLEYHPENEPAYRITVGWLGELLNRRQPPIPPDQIPGSNQVDSRYFSETGHTLSGDFLNYYEKQGGSVRFGLPISESFFLNGYLVQDFQSARFFWVPDQHPRVRLENIGDVHLQEIGLSLK